MPPLRDVPQRQAIRAFVRLGGVERSGKGSHRVVKAANGRNLSVPAGTLRTGLLRRLIRIAELTDEDFVNALEK